MLRKKINTVVNIHFHFGSGSADEVGVILKYIVYIHAVVLIAVMPDFKAVIDPGLDFCPLLVRELFTVVGDCTIACNDAVLVEYIVYRFECSVVCNV